VWERCGVAVAKTGGDFCWARHLPAALAAAGATGVATAVDGGIFAGGTTWAELIAMTWEQLIPRLVADGFPAELVAAATAELNAADRWFPAPALVAAWGRRPL
jgi:hypothetical protein